MNRFLAVQHSDSEFFGALESQWEARDIALHDLRTVTGQDVAGTPSRCDALWPPGAVWPIADAAHASALSVRTLARRRPFRPELKPGMLEDMVLEEDREVPQDMGRPIEMAREVRGALQATTERVAVALVEALNVMRARRKSPVVRLSLQR